MLRHIEIGLHYYPVKAAQQFKKKCLTWSWHPKWDEHNYIPTGRILHCKKSTNQNILGSTNSNFAHTHNAEKFT